MNRPPRVCLFGGTFDPIHSAHLRIAEEAKHSLQLDRVLFIPAAHPPHKQNANVTPYEHRLRMVEAAVAGIAGFEASRLEERESASYSVETVERLRPALPAGADLFFLIGSDAFDELETWHRWQDLVQLVEFIVVARPGAQFRVPPGATVHEQSGVDLPVSSTGIRERLARGEPTPELVPAVRAYIDRHQLYRTAQPA